MGIFLLVIHYSPLSQVPAAIDDDEFVRRWNHEPSWEDDEGDGSYSTMHHWHDYHDASVAYADS